VALHEEQVGCALYNEYGPAEATVWVTADRLSTREAGVTIGRAVPGTAVYVLDDRGERCAPGAPGEIFVAGPGVAKGYLGREDLSAERFLADPFESGSRMYRTGDRGRWLCDGRLDYLGRVDRQVKLLGYRVELGEIERALEAHPEIQEAGVIVASRQRGASSVAALVDRLAELDRTTADALIRETEAATPGELRGTTG
jgi:non-ribosomal peptide synthetase component F